MSESGYVNGLRLVSGLPAVVSASPDPRGSQSAAPGSVSVTPPEPAPCQACGHDTAADQTAVRFVCHVAGKEPELLALLCIRCHARGALWAARQSLRTFGGDEPLPPNPKHW